MVPPHPTLMQAAISLNQTQPAPKKQMKKILSLADTTKRALADMESKEKSADSHTRNSAKNTFSTGHTNHVAASRGLCANIFTPKCVSTP
jgi:conjugal transfer/entry exclusion protein